VTLDLEPEDAALLLKLVADECDKTREHVRTTYGSEFYKARLAQVEKVRERISLALSAEVMR